MKHIKKTFAVFFVTAVLLVGTSFANTGIIVNGFGASEETPPCVELDNKGIVLSDLTGIIVNGFTGIIVNGATDPQVDCGIIVNG